MNHFIKSSIAASFRVTLPVMAGYVFLGLTLGLLVRTSGFDWWVPILMSAVIYSGALEFAAVPLLSAAFDPLGAFMLAVTLSARHLFYGIPLLKQYEHTGASKIFLMFGLTDETFSILSTTPVPSGVSPKLFYGCVTLFDYLYWTGGTAVGALLGGAVTVDLRGLDFVLTALFVVLFLEQVKTKTGLKSGIIGLAAGAAALLAVGPSLFVIVTMVLIVIALMAGRRWIDRE